MPAHPDPALDLTAPLPSSGVVATARGPASFEGRSGVRIDHFVVERKIGAGGMGAIYAARDVALDRPVAIKILPDELAREPGAHERFVREAQAQARLSSPHVVQIFFIGRLPPDVMGRESAPGLVLTEPASSPAGARGSLYFAMELVDGESLEAPLARGEKLDPEQARRLMIQAAQGLDDAHRAGIVHRDVKPGNLLADRAGHLKIADFGLAKPREKNLSLTKEGAVMGTPYYMAPEQAIGDPVDFRADMYALGCTFYHLLGGEPPFDGPSPMAVMAKHLKSEPRPLREARPSVPAPLEAVIARLMQKEPRRRYPTYAALVDALEAAAPTRVERAGFWTRAAATAIDAALASVLIGALGWPGLVLFVAAVVAGQAYLGLSAAKYVLHVRVERSDGTRLGLGRSVVRLLALAWLPCWFGFLTLWTQGFATFKGSVAQLAELGAAKQLVVPILVGNVVLALLYGAGLAIAAVDPQKRAVHDHLVGSRVIYRLGSQKPALLPAAKKA